MKRGEQMQQRNEHHWRIASKQGAYAQWACAVSLFGLLAGIAHGEGFRNPPPGTFNLGRSGSRIAQIDDASAISQNPANLIEVTGLELQFTPTVVNITSEFQSPTGQTAETIDPWKLLPNFFLAAPLKDGKVALGLGITTPYGIGSSWDTGSSAFAPPTLNSAPGVFRYTAPYFAELKTINFNPGLAVKLGDHFQVGGGLDVMWTELTMKQFYPWLAFPGSVGLEPDGVAEGQGDGVGFGANLGVTWLITERQRLALTYRSPMSVNLEGDFKISNITPTASFIGATPTSQFQTKMQFPTIVAAGYGIRLSDTVRVGVDFEWLQFSRFESLDLNLGNNNFLIPDRSIDQNWKNTYTLGFGGDWHFAEHWVLRAGYQHYETPVPDGTFSPTIPDANQNVITVGLGFQTGRHSLEAAYGLDFYDTRQITDNQTAAFNGTYNFTVHLMSFAYRYRF
jgi:long-chain fatty acid transport protein